MKADQAQTEYSEITYGSSCYFRRFSHDRRFKQIMLLIDEFRPSALLDFGAADGHLFDMLRQHDHIKELCLYEPEPKYFESARSNLNDSRIYFVGSADVLERYEGTFDMITCLEVLEHLPERELAQTMHLFNKLSNENTRLVVSVPIEVGPPALAKNIIRTLIGHRHKNSSVANVARSVFYRTDRIPREVKETGAGSEYIGSHVGFDFRKMAMRLSEAFEIERTLLSPLASLPASFNTQITFVCRKR